MTAYPAELLRAVVATLVAHVEHIDMTAGGLGCMCGERFPARVPEGWRPAGYTGEGWAELDRTERRDLIKYSHVRSETAVGDFMTHRALAVLDAVSEHLGIPTEPRRHRSEPRRRPHGGRWPDPGLAAICNRCGEPREAHGGPKHMGACPGQSGLQGRRFTLRDEDKGPG